MSKVPVHLDLSDPQLKQAGAEILARYNKDEFTEHLNSYEAEVMAKTAAKRQLNAILADNHKATVTTIRKKLRARLETSPEGNSVEMAVEKLLS
ncbi:MAG: hypothetical protein F4138_00155 [Acidimicrobiia bacterium]|nr:hypothetical protein [Acidimicrobiia bacterium]MYC57894.1 hypothetical protein [Acidimicrobiia bacterium]MYG93399.1 hypothetical protein [Acidimicrobiia bacterium]MYI29798.1 hypothetical protein [Acidimicrobiia bacterium]